jgi:hypothetical protein
MRMIRSIEAEIGFSQDKRKTDRDFASGVKTGCSWKLALTSTYTPKKVRQH